MKWFIKCLRHYADFSGRAQRKEYWYFTLWYLIFYIAWALLAGLLMFSIHGMISAHIGSTLGPTVGSMTRIAAGLSAGSCFAVALLLPGWAVMGRRLHDVGKSAWISLAGLVPLVGGIWLLILMLTDGQPGDNQYGPNPKTSPQPFAANAISSTASGGAILFIIAAAVPLLLWVLQIWTSVMLSNSSPSMSMGILDWAGFGTGLVSSLLFSAAGICLLRQQVKSAFILLLVTASVGFVLSSMALFGTVIQFINTKADQPLVTGNVPTLVNFAFRTAFWLMLGLFAASVLSQVVVRKAAVVVIVIAGAYLLPCAYFHMERASRWLYDMDSATLLRMFKLWLPVFTTVLLLPVFSTIVIPIACMVLAIEFLAGSKALRIAN